LVLAELADQILVLLLQTAVILYLAELQQLAVVVAG
jgi:hypothetical protein